jgi:hypothetical protein
VAAERPASGHWYCRRAQRIEEAVGDGEVSVNLPLDPGEFVQLKKVPVEMDSECQDVQVR